MNFYLSKGESGYKHQMRGTSSSKLKKGVTIVTPNYNQYFSHYMRQTSNRVTAYDELLSITVTFFPPF